MSKTFELVIILPCVVTVRAADREAVLSDEATVSGVRVIGAEDGENLKDAVVRLLEVNPRSLNPKIRNEF